MILTWNDVLHRVDVLRKICDGKAVFGIPRGGAVVAGLMLASNVKGNESDGLHVAVVSDPAKADIIIDDIIDSGSTQLAYREKYGKTVVALVDKSAEDLLGQWVTFPWEVNDPLDGPERPVQRIIEHIGANPRDAGLLRTPARVVASWDELFSGYTAELDLTWFDDPTDEMVIVKGIDFYSTCEHHMLPFYGSVSIGYIPTGRIVGVSKLARLVDVYARRLQVQERMTRQIADALQEYVDSVAVSVTGQHLCMMARGVRQGASSLVTNVMTGSFREKPETRSEFIQAIK